MIQYDLKGEDLKAAADLERADYIEFGGVAVYRLWGSEEGIAAATEILNRTYPEEYMPVLSDAVWLGTVKSEDGEPYEDLYELIVLRETHGG